MTGFVLFVVAFLLVADTLLIVLAVRLRRRPDARRALGRLALGYASVLALSALAGIALGASAWGATHDPALAMSQQVDILADRIMQVNYALFAFAVFVLPTVVALFLMLLSPKTPG